MYPVVKEEEEEDLKKKVVDYSAITQLYLARGTAIPQHAIFTVD